ncbi:4-deoxy-4-formamido-L-arabinose-phosphoundecaprenol deformylase [Geobacter sp. AOG1]|uniref:4-deoxy-4-formamido-L-arabinose- phosphoundecaprenol deformylase n=1 Tax=Geobacter sp. AOG1 TaxID=1566346 RepID=UPI001CC33AE8|nr:4-deoxy-4-formamido-L-arabinose-phosphoundecaprenol deformylase [Geobacter sp. AOG1]GFE57653.1 4-deoxy-4-formamido-L-arabinose-phosphoundecaprenol deformylase [Geobacter sp. AOG1]
MNQPVIALKVDIDTFVGTRDGVPNLLAILARFGIRGTFYFSMGPDNSGKAIRRIFRPGFLKKQLRSGAPSAFGLRTLLSGTLLPPPIIAAKLPEVLKMTEKAGHVVGIHCWDHVKWHDYLPWFPKPVTAMELGKASALYQEVLGHRALTTAAPGWTVSADSLEVQDAMHLSYCSDCRGSHPFYPVMDGRTFRTLQIPTTWPTMDELLGENGITPETINDHYLTLLKPGLNVHTIHTEFEGMAMSQVFTDLLTRLTQRGVRFVTLAEVAEEAGPTAPVAPLAMSEIPGRAMPVAIQG